MTRRGAGSQMFGASSRLELMMRFCIWALALRAIPTPEQIADRFGVERATAYRWRNAFCDATGEPIPEPRPARPRGQAIFPVRATRRRQPASPTDSRT